ncbi:hypothetical protein [Caballeronia sordidicola]|nr:hypothetical protein [Caballeronia sordidicola]
MADASYGPSENRISETTPEPPFDFLESGHCPTGVYWSLPTTRLLRR